VLRDRHLRVVDLFRSRGIESLADTEACVEALADERLRAEFAVKLKAFLARWTWCCRAPRGCPSRPTPRSWPSSTPAPATATSDTPVLGKDVGAKVRKLIDDHVISLGIDPKIPPISADRRRFRHASQPRAERPRQGVGDGTRHPRPHPRAPGRGPGRLPQAERAAEVDAFAELIKELQADQPVGGEALPDLPPEYLPFLRILTQAKLGDEARPDAATEAQLVDATVEIVQIIIGELRIPDFWKPARIPDQERLKGASSRSFSTAACFPWTGWMPPWTSWWKWPGPTMTS
jgi:type I restriction enzyme, R subunit